MSKIAVVYKTKYGSTQKYAKWVAKALDADLFETAKADAKRMDAYHTIILGGGLYAGGILGADFITKNIERFKEKNIVVFTVGLANPKLTDYSKIIQKNFSPELRKAIKFYHFRGAIDYKNISVLHKGMMALLVKMAAKTDEKERDDETNQMIETYGKTVDFTDESSIEELVSYCKALA